MSVWFSITAGPKGQLGCGCGVAQNQKSHGYAGFGLWFQLPRVPFWYMFVRHSHMAVGENQWYHFGVGAPPILVHFSGGWDVHWGCGLLTHGHMSRQMRATSFSSRLSLRCSPLLAKETPRARGCGAGRMGVFVGAKKLGRRLGEAYMAVGQKWVPKMGCPGTWNKGLKPAVLWWLIDPHPYVCCCSLQSTDCKLRAGRGGWASGP